MAGWITDAPRRLHAIVEPNVVELANGDKYPALAMAFQMVGPDAERVEPITVNLVGSIESLRALQTSIGKALTKVQRSIG